MTTEDEQVDREAVEKDAAFLAAPSRWGEATHAMEMSRMNDDGETEQALLEVSDPMVPVLVLASGARLTYESFEELVLDEWRADGPA